MYKFLIIEIAMKMAEKHFKSDLYEIYFGDNFYIHYNEDVPLLVIGLKKGANEKAVSEFLAGIPGIRFLHEMLFGIRIKYFLLSEKEFKNKNFKSYNL